MSEIIFINSNNPDYESKLDDLIMEAFGFSFAPWFALGLWDERYESYSIIENGHMLSNICIYKSELIINGKTMRANQLGAIATRKNAQGRGLSRLLIEHVLSLYPDTPAYLAANESVTDFYPRFGFERIQTYVPVIAADVNNFHIATKIDIDDLVVDRGCYSQQLDCINSQPIQMFHYLMAYEDDIYYLPNLDIIVVAQQYDDELYVADVIAKKPVVFEQIKHELPFNGIKTIKFGFSPDWLGVKPGWAVSDELIFIKGRWNLPQYCCFPATSQT